MYIKVLKWSLAVILIIIGAIGLFVPIVPGILILLAGLFIIGIRKEHIKNWFRKLKF